jgi:hypothetical protein
MGQRAVRVQVAGDGFVLLAENDSAEAAERLRARIAGLPEQTDASLRLRPRTSPDPADRSDAPEGHAYRAVGDADSSVPEDEEPGTEWHEVLGSAVQAVDVIELDGPTALWHWTINSP